MVSLVKHDIKDVKLAPQGKKRIEWAALEMPVIAEIGKRFAREKPLKGKMLAACLHVTAETANLVRVLKAGGATVVVCASNPLSTQDDVAASLVSNFGVATFAIKGEDNVTYYRHLNQALDFKPQLTMDDGADLVARLHQILKRSNPSKQRKGSTLIKKGWEFYGSSEETTTGVIRLRALEREGRLQFPVMAANDSATKHLFDNRYGTGQSTIDGIMRATNVLLAGKTFVVVGYGYCGRGVAMRAEGMGANVVVVEAEAVRALEAAMDGYRVMTMKAAAAVADIVVTVTGDKRAVSLSDMKLMKDGVILANSGHFDVEIDVAGLQKQARKARKVREFVTEYVLSPGKRIYLLAEGRLVNLSVAEGHPPAVMDMSFANQALAAEYLVKNQGKLEKKVYVLPKEIDTMVASLKLKSMGMGVQQLTREQKKYLTSWEEGT
ncbi:MAG: adenosylhomocysteinase [Candidatus Chisholmbacteria bacterium]|nr:adenosylhomocysteinase [Candidatus Chisholmbacteria bacterium]